VSKYVKPPTPIRLIPNSEQCALCRSGRAKVAVRRDSGGAPSSWIASINSTALGEFLEREIAMRRIEELVEASMALVLHDWELYRATKERR